MLFFEPNYYGQSEIMQRKKKTEKKSFFFCLFSAIKCMWINVAIDQWTAIVFNTISSVSVRSFFVYQINPFIYHLLIQTFLSQCEKLLPLIVSDKSFEIEFFFYFIFTSNNRPIVLLFRNAGPLLLMTMEREKKSLKSVTNGYC